MPDRPQNITFVHMRDMRVPGVLIYCADYALKNQHKRLVLDGDAMIKKSNRACAYRFSRRRRLGIKGAFEEIHKGARFRGGGAAGRKYRPQIERRKGPL
jgi:hypothetical protein